MADGAGGADVKLGESAESEIGGCESEETGRVSGESGGMGLHLQEAEERSWAGAAWDPLQQQHRVQGPVVTLAV